MVPLDVREVVGGQAVGKGSGCLRNVERQADEMVGRPFGQAEVGVGDGPGRRPRLLVQDQRPEPRMAATLGQIQVAGAQGVTDRQRESGFPNRAAQAAAVIAQDPPPSGRNKVGRCVLRQGLEFAVIELTDQGDGVQQRFLPGVGDERQGQEVRQGLSQIGITGEDGIDDAAAVLGGDRLAGGDRALQALGSEAATQAGHRFLIIADEHLLAGIEQGEQAVVGRPAQASGFSFGGMAGAAHQAGHMGVVGLDHLVKQSLTPIDQKTHQQAVTLVAWKAPQGATVVASAQLGKLPAVTHRRDPGDRSACPRFPRAADGLRA